MNTHAAAEQIVPSSNLYRIITLRKAMARWKQLKEIPAMLLMPWVGLFSKEKNEDKTLMENITMENIWWDLQSDSIFFNNSKL